MKKLFIILSLLFPLATHAFNVTPSFFTDPHTALDIDITGASDWCSFNSDGTPWNHANSSYNTLNVDTDLTTSGLYSPNMWMVFSNDDCTSNGDYWSELSDPDFLGSFCIGENEPCDSEEEEATSTNPFFEAISDDFTGLTSIDINSVGTAVKEDLKLWTAISLAWLFGLWPYIVAVVACSAVFIIAKWGRRKVI